MAQTPQNPALKRYVCIGYFDPNAMNRVPRDEMQRILAKCGPHMTSLYASNAVVIDAGLSNQAWWIQRMNGTQRTLDGPFAETKECVGSVLLIEAADDDEALRVARLHPTTQIPEGEHLGWRIEVRPVQYFHAAQSGGRGTDCET
jgi:hypothetical protein